MENVGRKGLEPKEPLPAVSSERHTYPARGAADIAIDVIIHSTSTWVTAGVPAGRRSVGSGFIMSIPIVAIVGRPNVGKSSLLNCISRQMISIVDPTAGVTRDRVSTICEWNDAYFELVDTGGYGVVDCDDLSDHIERQIIYAIQQASLVLFVVDVQDGVMPLDRRVAELLRQHDRPVLLLANKADDDKHEPGAAEFFSLGFDQPICISALHARGRRDLCDRIVERVRPLYGTSPPVPVMKIALVGRRNVGKSTFINALAGNERVIVSETPGTTRDSVDVRFERDGREFIAIDTAGIRKKTKMKSDIEFYGYTRAQRSIRRADVVLLLIDATDPIGDVDKKLARFIVDEYKPCILVINKWDLAKGRATSSEYGEYLDKVLPEVSYAPIALTTAKDNRNIPGVIDLAGSLYKQALMRVGTAQLNQGLEEAMALRGPSPKRGAKPPKIYYATQVSVRPPTVVCFVNDPALIKADYQRFLINRFRDILPFSEIPIRLFFRARNRRGDEATRGAKQNR